MTSLLPVHAKLHPFRPGIDRLEVPQGASYREIAALSLAGAPSVIVDDIVIRANGEVVPRLLWAARPKRGVVIEVMAMPRGGTAGRAILLAAVFIVAAILAAPTGGGSLVAAAGLTGTAAVVAGAVIFAAVSVAGQLAVNALIPPPEPDLNNAGRISPQAQLEGARNQPRFRQAVPMNLGRNKVVPQLAGEFVNDGSGRDSFLRMLVLWGYGKQALSDQKIGSNDLDTFDGVSNEFRDGSAVGPPNFSLYPNDISGQIVNSTVTNSGGPVTRTTAKNTTQIQVFIFFPEGLVRIGKETTKNLERTVAYRIETSPAGQNVWTNFTDDPLFTTFDGRNAINVRRRTPLPFRLIHRIDVAAGEYDVRVTRIFPDEGQINRKSTIVWQQLLSVDERTSPINLGGVAATALRIRASERLNGTINDYSGVLQSVCLDWDSGTQTWIERATRNPASLYRLCLQGRHLRAPIPDSQIDLAALQAWHEYCDAEGLSCDIFIDFDAVLGEILSIVTAAGFATWVVDNGIFTVIVDQPKTEVVQMWTPRNIQSFTAVRTFGRPVHGLIGKFRNADEDFRSDDVVVYAPGFDEDNATEVDELDLIYVTDPRQAYKITQRRLAERLLRTTIYQINVGWDWLVARRGDLVALGEESVQIGAGGGRIKALVLSGDSLFVEQIQLDSKTVLDAATVYAIRLRKGAGTIERHTLAAVSGDVDTLPLQDPIAIADAPSIGDLVWIGALNVETLLCLVKSITPGPDLTAALELIPYAPDVFTGTIPEEIPSFTTPVPGQTVPLIAQVLTGEAAGVRHPDGTFRQQAVVTIIDAGSRPATRLSAIQVRWRKLVLPVGEDPNDPEQPEDFQLVTAPIDDDNVIIPNVEPGTTIEVQARYVFKDGVPGEFSGSVTHDVVGAFIAPPDVTSIFQDGEFVRWTLVSPPVDLIGYDLREAQNNTTPFDQATPVHDGVFGGDSFEVALLSGNATHVMIKAVSVQGLKSDNARTVAIDRSLIDGRFEFSRLKISEAGYPGDITGATVVGTTLEADETTLFIPDPDGLFIPSATAVWLDSQFASVTFDLTFTVPTTARDGYRIRLDTEATGEHQIYYRFVDDELQQLSLSDPLPDATDTLPPAWAPYPSLLLGDTARPLTPWRGVARAFAGKQIRFVVLGRGGQTRFVMTKFHIIVDAPELREQVVRFGIPEAGAVVPFAKDFGGIVAVMATLRSEGERASVVRASLDDGVPFVQAFNAVNDPVSTFADVELIGFG